jgi:hypothetical protein
MTRKQQVLAAIKTAAAQGDMKTATSLFLNHRISRDLYDQTVESGRRLAALVQSQKSA